MKGWPSVGSGSKEGVAVDPTFEPSSVATGCNVTLDEGEEATLAEDLFHLKPLL